MCALAGDHAQQLPAQDQAGNGAGVEQPIFQICCAAGLDYCLCVRGDLVVFARSDPFDMRQQWYKDMRFSTKVHDDEGIPAFVIVNKATGLAINHSDQPNGHPVSLLEFDPNSPHKSQLWTESNYLCATRFRRIRPVNHIRLSFQALTAGSLRDGTTIVLFEQAEGMDVPVCMHWKILPWDDDAAYGNNLTGGAGSSEDTFRLYCDADRDFNATLRNGTVCLAPKNRHDSRQYWIKDCRRSHKYKDDKGRTSFAIVNRVTGEAMQHTQLKLVPYQPDDDLGEPGHAAMASGASGL